MALKARITSCPLLFIHIIFYFYESNRQMTDIFVTKMTKTD